MTAPAKNGNAAADILRTVLTAVGVMVPIMGALWTLGIGPIHDDLREVKRWQARAPETFLSKESSSEYRQRISDQQKRIEQDFASVDQRLQVIFRNHVTQSDIAILQREINEIKNRVGLLYPIDKVLDDMNKRMDRMQDVLSERKRQ